MTREYYSIFHESINVADRDEVKFVRSPSNMYSKQKTIIQDSP